MAAVTFVIAIFGLLQTSWSIELFDPSSEKCCSGQIIQMPPPPPNATEKEKNWVDFHCCGQDIYNVTTHICCLNNVHPRPPANTSANEFYSCCGAEVYDTSTSLCCDGTVILPNSTSSQSGDGDIFDNDVGVGFLDSHVFCCGPQTYDWKKSMCCSSEDAGSASVVDRPSPFSECCGSQTYDIRKRMCCSNVVRRSKDPNSTYRLLCCGQDTYNPVKSICCNGNLVVAKPEYGRSYICCGDKPQLKHEEMCCGNTVVPISGNNTENLRCCGSTTYDHESELCCNGVPHPDPDKDIYCCGTDVFRPELKEFCCGHVVHRIFTSDIIINNVSRAISAPIPVCCGNATLNDPQTEMCCEGHPVSRSFGRSSRCCGPDVMDGDRSLCCKGRIWQHANSSDACCGDTVYDTSRHSCCYENRTYSVIEQTDGRHRSTCCYG